MAHEVSILCLLRTDPLSPFVALCASLGRTSEMLDDDVDYRQPSSRSERSRAALHYGESKEATLG